MIGMEHGVNVALSLRAPGEVRHSLKARYAESMEPSLLDDVVLATSEMVSNAVVHSGCPEGDPITVQATVDDDVLHVEVADNGRGVDPLVARSSSPPSGLSYVEFVSDRWSSHNSQSFHVWFEIDITHRTVLHRKTS
jgi:anti-sigma regulatory factor (Ser/Thr protein kinase)